MPSKAAMHLHAAISRPLNTSAWQLRLWDGTVVEPDRDPQFVFSIRTRRALDLLIGGMPERAFGRAYTSGGLDIEPLEGDDLESFLTVNLDETFTSSASH